VCPSATPEQLVIAVARYGFLGNPPNGNAGMRPGRRIRPGEDGGLRAAQFQSYQWVTIAMEGRDFPVGL